MSIISRLPRSSSLTTLDMMVRVKKKTGEVQSNLVQGGDGAGHGNLLALLVHSADVLEQTSEHDGLGRLLVPGGEEVVVS